MGLSKVQNLEHKYRVIKAKLLRKADGAQSSIGIKPIPPKDIDSWTLCLAKGPWKNSHDLRPIMTPHTYIILLSKLAKRNMQEKKGGIVRMK